MNRRAFLKSAAATATLLAVGPYAQYVRAEPAVSNRALMPQRPLGKGGATISVVGFAGLLLKHLDQEQSNRCVAEAVERGALYFDVAPKYGDSEAKLGPALEPYRKKCFLATKTACRDAAGAKADFEGSLKRLKTDRIDLLQFHHLRHVDKDVDTIFAKGGALEFALEAKKDGRIRHIGFSAHSEEAALAALDRFEFDSMIIAVSFVPWLNAGYAVKVLEKAKAKGVTVLGMKTLSRQRWASREDPERVQKWPKLWYQPVSDPVEQDLAVRFTLSQPGVASCLPPANDVLWRRAVDIGMDPRPITPEETAKLKAVAASLTPVFPRKEGEL